MAPKKKVAIPTLFELWQREMSIKDICAQLGVSISHLRRLARQHKLPVRKKIVEEKNKIIDPTPEELAQRMIETRANWSEKEKDRRYCGPKRKNWQIPAYTYNENTGNFTRD